MFTFISSWVMLTIIIHGAKMVQNKLKGVPDVLFLNPRGRKVTGNLNLDHALNSKHSIGGSFGVDHTKIKG